MSTDLLQGLMGLNSGVAVPQGTPLLQGENPMAGLRNLPAGTIPGTTPAPMTSLNPTDKVTSMEDLLFGIGGNIYG